MYMDDTKLLAKIEKELETLIHTVRIYSQDIGMEFGIENCAMLVMKSGKKQLADGKELPNQDEGFLISKRMLLIMYFPSLNHFFNNNNNDNNNNSFSLEFE